VESGEGIERDELETTGKVVGKGPWNPVKELKEDDQMRCETSECMWNPVKELKDQCAECRNVNLVDPWNPVKELKD